MYGVVQAIHTSLSRCLESAADFPGSGTDHRQEYQTTDDTSDDGERVRRFIPLAVLLTVPGVGSRLVWSLK